MPVVAHTIDGRINGTTGPLDPYIEGSRLFHVSESTDSSRAELLGPFRTSQIVVAFQLRHWPSFFIHDVCSVRHSPPLQKFCLSPTS